MIRPVRPGGIGATAERLRKARRAIGSGWSAQGGAVLWCDASRARKQQGDQAPKTKPPTWAKNAVPPPFALAPSIPKFASRNIAVIQLTPQDSGPQHDGDVVDGEAPRR